MDFYLSMDLTSTQHWLIYKYLKYLQSFCSGIRCVSKRKKKLISFRHLIIWPILVHMISNLNRVYWNNSNFNIYFFIFFILVEMPSEERIGWVVSTHSCQNFCEEAWWFLSLRVFRLLSSSFRSSSGVCWTWEPSRNYVLCWTHGGRLFWFRLP